MSSARGRANHALYLARVVVAGWREALAKEDIPAAILAQAYLGCATGHLVAAYGWFLLEVSQTQPLPAKPPCRCDELPGPDQGQAVPAEVNEFRQLEANGWLGEMLAEPVNGGPGPARQAHNLAVAASKYSGPEQVQEWLTKLEALFDRMSDSLEEY